MLPYAERYYKSIKRLNLTEEQISDFRKKAETYLNEQRRANNAITDKIAASVLSRITESKIEDCIRNKRSPESLVEALLF